MKKIIALLALLLVTACLFTACVDRQPGESEVTTPSLDQMLQDIEDALNEDNSGKKVFAEVIYKVNGDHAEVVGCEFPIGEVEVLAEFEGKPVTTIAAGAFNGINTFTSVKLPDTIVTIADNAFMSCSAMTAINIPASVKTIGKYAFFGCAALTEIELGSGVESVGANAFGSCTVLKEIKVAAGNGSFACEDGVLFSADKSAIVAYPTAKEATSYTIPASVKTVENFAFAYAANLISVSMTGVTSLGDYTFSSCPKLEQVDLGTGLTFLGAGTFQKCYSLKNITIPEGIKTIGYIDADGNEAGSTFYNCMSLTDITMPKSLTNIYRRSFYGCDGLTKVHYSGTTAEWEKVNISSDNDAIKNIGIAQ